MTLVERLALADRWWKNVAVSIRKGNTPPHYTRRETLQMSLFFTCYTGNPRALGTDFSAN